MALHRGQRFSPPSRPGAFGETRNPWQLDHTPGGSAVAVAAGLVPVAVGSDGAGSIRIPAAWTHLVGIKPRRGLISTAPANELFHGITTSGPLARRTADAALLLDVLSDQHRFAAAADRDPGRLRIGLSVRPPFTGYHPRLDPAVRAAVHRLANVLAGLGHDIRPAEPDYGLIGLNFLLQSTAGLYDWLPRIPDPTLLDPRTSHNIANGRRFGRHLLGFSRATAARFQRRVARVFQDVDVILAPTTAQPPPLVGAWAHLGPNALNRAMVTACPYAWPWNVLGWPAINVPAGFTDDGLPLGAQLLGLGGTEERLISLAAQLEQEEKWITRRPSG